MQPYIHQTRNRLRIRSDFIRDNRADVESLIEQLNQIEGINEIHHRQHAGSVTILFDHNNVSADVLLETVESHGWLKGSGQSALLENAVRTGTKTLCRGLIYMALKRTVGPTVMRALAAL